MANLVPRALQHGELGERWCLETAASPADQREVDWVIGAVHCIRRAALAGDAPYREHSFMYVEDLDLCWRLRQGGWTTVFDPAVTVVHAGNAAGAQAWGNDRTRRWMEATYDWYRRERGPGPARAYAALNLTGAATEGDEPRGDLSARRTASAGASPLGPRVGDRRSRSRQRDAPTEPAHAHSRTGHSPSGGSGC